VRARIIYKPTRDRLNGLLGKDIKLSAMCRQPVVKDTGTIPSAVTQFLPDQEVLSRSTPAKRHSAIGQVSMR
jgi:hypothetical protein